MLQLCLTAEQAIQWAESLSERFDMFGGGKPAGDQITEETVIFAHRLQDEDEALCHVCSHGIMLYLQNTLKTQNFTRGSSLNV